MKVKVYGIQFNINNCWVTQKLFSLKVNARIEQVKNEENPNLSFKSRIKEFELEDATA